MPLRRVADRLRKATSSLSACDGSAPDFLWLR